MNQTISDRVSRLDLSGIRRVFDLAQSLENPINLSIGQPDFPTPEPIKAAAISAIENDRNAYTPTQGHADLITALKQDSEKRGLNFEDLIVTSGVSGGLFLAFSSLLNPGDEVIVPDPYFLMYKQLANFLDAKLTYIKTYPHFKLTAEMLEPHLNDKTKLLVLNFPGNPTGVGLEKNEWEDLCDLLARFPKLNIISDEIYRLFHYGDDYFSPATKLENVITLDGFSKSHSVTGWRVAWASGPKNILQQMAKLQQFTFVCAPSPAQSACLDALNYSMEKEKNAYSQKRDLIVSLLKDKFELAEPQGTFYIFPKVPDGFQNAQSFVEKAISKNVLIIPGNVFSEQDTHFRISFATDNENLEKGAQILGSLA